MAAALQPRSFSRAYGRWSDAETAAFINSWALLYVRRRGGKGDMWLPQQQHLLVRRARGHSSRALVVEDWRAVASAVNSHRADAGLGSSVRTYVQCKLRMGALKNRYRKELAAPAPSRWLFFNVLHGVWGDEAWSRAAAAKAGGAAADGRGEATAGAVEDAAAADALRCLAAAAAQNGGAAAEVIGGGVADGVAAGATARRPPSSVRGRRCTNTAVAAKREGPASSSPRTGTPSRPP